jgi:hypothetical protein
MSEKSIEWYQAQYIADTETIQFWHDMAVRNLDIIDKLTARLDKIDSRKDGRSNNA